MHRHAEHCKELMDAMAVYVRAEWPPVHTLDGLLELYTQARQWSVHATLLPPWAPPGDGGLVALAARAAVLQAWCDTFDATYKAPEPVSVSAEAPSTESECALH